MPWNAFANIVGSMLDSANVTATNESNQWQNIVTNQANKDINESQLEWAREQYEMEKAENRFLVDQAYERDIEQRENERKYNSPAAMIQRYLAAGINPFLAMQGGSAGSFSAGSGGSVRSQVGQNAHANQPSMIPMQNGAPAIPYTGFGQGLSDAVKNYYLGKESERSDFALAADITFRDRKAIQDSLNYILELKKHGVNDKWINSQIDHLLRADQLDQDKLSHQREVDSFNAKIEEYNAETQRLSVQIQHMLARSNIAVNNEQINLLASNAALARIEAAEMRANGVSQREINKYIANREKESMEILRRQNDREKRQNSGVARQTYIDFTDWLFTPLKGLISIGIK